MKQLIVLTAVLPMMLLFVAQFALDQRNHAMTTYAEEIVQTACEKARAEGCFTAEIQNELRRALSERLGISPETIGIDADEGVVYRLNYFDASSERGLIRYSISIPIGRRVASSGFFTRAEENWRILTFQGVMASERLP